MDGKSLISVRNRQCYKFEQSNSLVSGSCIQFLGWNFELNLNFLTETYRLLAELGIGTLAKYLSLAFD